MECRNDDIVRIPSNTVPCSGNMWTGESGKSGPPPSRVRQPESGTL